MAVRVAAIVVGGDLHVGTIIPPVVWVRTARYSNKCLQMVFHCDFSGVKFKLARLRRVLAIIVRAKCPILAPFAWSIMVRIRIVAGALRITGHAAPGVFHNLLTLVVWALSMRSAVAEPSTAMVEGAGMP